MASGLRRTTEDALFGLGFPPAPGLLSLNLAMQRNSQAHSTKGTPSPRSRKALTACRSTVSVSVSLPSRGSFHLSLTVLSAIGSCKYLALGDGPPGFRQGSSCPAVLKSAHAQGLAFRLRGSHPLWPAFPCRSATQAFSSNCAGPGKRPDSASYNPSGATACPLHAGGLGSCPFARRY